jgi:hypothetical protein
MREGLKMEKVKRKKKGYLLITSMFLSLILLIMGMSFLGVKTMQYGGSGLIGSSLLADGIAQAGMEEAKLKLEKDLLFPPPGDEAQKIFSYSEDFLDIDGVTNLGSYTVTIDSRKKDAPYLLVVITSAGTAGPADKALARRKITAEVDVSPTVRGSSPAASNPRYFQFINWLDSGGL